MALLCECLGQRIENHAFIFIENRWRVNNSPSVCYSVVRRTCGYGNKEEIAACKRLVQRFNRISSWRSVHAARDRPLLYTKRGSIDHNRFKLYSRAPITVHASSCVFSQINCNHARAKLDTHATHISIKSNVARSHKKNTIVNVVIRWTEKVYLIVLRGRQKNYTDRLDMLVE